MNDPPLQEIVSVFFFYPVLTFHSFDFIHHSLCAGSSSSSPSSVWGWMKPMLSYMFGTLWVLPIFLLSRAVSSLWFQVRQMIYTMMHCICDTIKGNESLVEKIYFYFLTPLSQTFKMLHFDANPITIGYLVTEL